MSGARRVTALLCRTSDRGPEGATGARELGELLDAREVGRPTTGCEGRYDEDLHESHGCLLEAGGQVDDALDAGDVPVLIAGDCSICVGTLPVLVRQRPDAHVLWVDAHPDFNSPETTPSGFLGGMCLAGACGLWDTGFDGTLDPARVVTWGVRDVDPGERVALDRHGVHQIERAEQLDGRAVFVHVDLDVLRNDVMPARFPAAGGEEPAGLREFLAGVAASCEIVGAQITSVAPGHSEIAADAVAPLL